MPNVDWTSHGCYGGGGCAAASMNALQVNLRHYAATHPMSAESSHVCERCGAPARITVAVVSPNRGGLRPPRSEHHYCRACATAAGVPNPRLGERATPGAEPEQPTWLEIEQHLASYEAILRDDPSLRD